MEQLEPRCLLAGGVVLTGVPTWVTEGPAPNTNGQDENIPAETGGGPNAVSGAVESIAVNPGNSNIVFVGGVNGGVWKTTNLSANPVNWTPLTDQYPALEISALKFDPTDSTNQTVVAGIGNTSNIGTNLGPITGLLKTTDGGTTWKQLGNTSVMGLRGENVSAVIPRGNTILVAAANGSAPGLYKSIDGGVTFPLLSGTNGLNKGPVYDLASDPSNANRVYAVVGGATGGVFRTDNLGVSWTNVTNLAAITTQLTSGSLSNARLSVSAAATNPVYLATAINGQLSGVFGSASLGVAWTAMDLPQTLDASRTITSATNASPIVVTVSSQYINGTAPSIANGDRIRIGGVAGNTAANGDYTITVISSTQFQLNGTTGNGAYTGGGTSRVIQGINHGRQASPNLTIATDPSNANLVYIAGDRQDFLGGDSSIGAFAFSGRIFRGDASVAAQGAGAVVTDAIHQWTPLTDVGTSNTSSPHADSRAMVIDGGQLLYSGDGGLFEENVPTNATGQWYSKNGVSNGGNSGLQVTQFSSDLSYDSLSNIIFGGAQDTGTPQQSASGSQVYQDQTRGDGPFTAVDDLTSATQSARYIMFNRQYYNAVNATVGAGVGLIPVAGVSGFTNFGVLAVSGVAPPSGQSTRVVIANGTNAGVSAIFDSTNAGIAATTGAIVYTQIPTGPGWNGVNTFFGIFAIAVGGTRSGVVNQDVLYAASGSTIFLRNTAGGTLSATSALPAIAGSIQSVALDPNDWMTAYVTDGSNVFQTTNAGGTWKDITGNLKDNLIHTITVADSGSGVSAVLVGETNGVFRMLSGVPKAWSEFGTNLPNSSVWGLQYNAAKDLLVVGTSGRGAWEIPTVSNTLFTQGTLEIDGDQDFPNENDTIKLVLDPLNPLILDVYLNSATPVFTVPFASVQTIVVKALGGNDNLIIDRTNGDPVPIPGGLTYVGGTHTLPGVDELTIVGAGASSGTFTRDPSTLDAGTLAIDGSMITFVNSQLTNISNIQLLTILGSNASQGSYSPDGVTADKGTFVVGAATIQFDTVQALTASSIATFTLTTPNAADSAKISPTGVTANLITGSSGGVDFTPLTFFAITNFTFDGAKNGQSHYANDAILIDNPGGPALIASGLQNFTINTGAGNDVLTINANDFRLPVPGGAFTFNAGTGLLSDGTTGSNLRGQISLDRVVVNADEDFTLVDLPHIRKDGKPIADDTPPGVNLSLSQHSTGSSLGTLIMIGVEVATLDGGVGDNVIDASKFSGALLANGGGGNDTLIGGSGNNTLISGAGNSTLIGGNQRTDGATNNILGGGGVNLLIAGPGVNTLIAGSGTTTMIGGVGQDTFVINNPAGTVLAPIGGYEVIGANNPGDRLILMGGGGKAFKETWVVGPLPDPSAPANITTPNNLGLDIPVIQQPANFDGVITIANGFTGLTQPVTQEIRYAGIASVFDMVTAKSLTVIAAPKAGTLSVTSATNLAAGRIGLALGGVAVKPGLYAFANKSQVGIYGANGRSLIPPFPAVKAAVAGPVIRASAIAASPIIAASPAATAASIPGNRPAISASTTPATGSHPAGPIALAFRSKVGRSKTPATVHPAKSKADSPHKAATQMTAHSTRPAERHSPHPRTHGR